MNFFKMDGNEGLHKALFLNAISGLLSLTGIETTLKLTLLIVSIVYTSFKFYDDYKKSKK